MEAASSADRQVVAGRYRLDELLGQGGMGTVWRAHDDVLGRDVAVKRLRQDRLSGPEWSVARGRMLREARIAAKLQHPNIVSIFDVVEQDEPWLILEYVASRSLAEVLNDRGPMVPSDIAAIGAQVAAALAAAHVRDIVHRDIKPANLLLVGGADDALLGAVTVKVTDWGISCVTGGADVTGTNVESGTPAYFAPEVARGEGADARSDVYALGATLYELLEGRPPFGHAEGNVFALLARISTGDVPPPRRTGPLADAVVRLVSLDPAQRPSAAEAWRMLRVLRDGRSAPEPTAGALPTAGHGFPAAPETVTAPTLVGPAAPPARPARSWWRRPWMLAGCGVAITVAVVVSLVLATREAPTEIEMPALGRIELGDPRTVDPCSLAQPGALDRFGTATVQPDLGTFPVCVMDLDVSDDPTDDVRVEIQFVVPLALGSELAGRQERLGEATLVRSARDGDACDRELVLSDRHRVAIEALDRAESPVQLCAIAEATAAAVVDRLRTSGIGRRDPLEAGSGLARVDACGLLGAAELTVVPGLDVQNLRPGFGGWLCNWGQRSDPTRTAVLLEYDRRRSLPSTGGGGRNADIAGLRGYAQPTGSACRANFVHRRFDGAGGPRLETVGVWVYGPLPGDERCRLATMLAAAVVPKLPPPS